MAKPRDRRPPPRGRLEFSHMLSFAGPEPDGMAPLRELPNRSGAHICCAIRGLLAFCRGPESSAAIFDSGALGEWELKLLAEREHFDEELWYPLFLIAGELAKPYQADVPAVAWSCMLMADWAGAVNAPATAAELVQVAAVLWPEHPRYAWMAGRFLRTYGYAREAYLWFTRAARVGFRLQDREAQSMALNSLGNLCIQQGAIEKGSQYLNRALIIARTHRLREREAKVLHDLFVLAVMRGEEAAAEQHALRAFACYGDAHSDLPKLAHDIAHLWCDQGYFRRALPVFSALLPLFHDPEARLRILASAARAAGGSADFNVFQRMWAEAQLLLPHPSVAPIVAESLVEVALGATSIAQWNDARDALHQALAAAARWGQSETAACAERILDRVGREEGADAPARPARVLHPADGLAEGLVKGLETQLAAAGIEESIRRQPHGELR